MITKIGKHEVELYDEIERLPILRFHKFNKFLLIDSGIGSDLSDFDNHIERVLRYNRQGKPDLLEKEVENLRQNVYFIQSGISPKNLAFATLVTKIDGVEYNDLSDDGLQKVLDILGDVPQKELSEVTDQCKKKIDYELSLYFPELFDSADQKEYFIRLKKRAMLMLEDIISGENNNAQEIEKITDYLVTSQAPPCFSGKDSVELQHDKNFEEMCLSMSRELNVQPKSFTVLEYYNAVSVLRKESIRQKAQRMKRKAK